MVFPFFTLAPKSVDPEYEEIKNRLRRPFGFEDTDNPELVRAIFRRTIQGQYDEIANLYVLCLSAELNFNTNLTQAKDHIHMAKNPSLEVAKFFELYQECFDGSIDDTIGKINSWFDNLCGAVDVYNYESEYDALDLAVEREYKTAGPLRQFFRNFTGYRPKPKS